MKIQNLLNFLLIGSLSVAPAYAGGDHHHHNPPPPDPVDVPDNGSNHNAIVLAIFIAAGVCVYYQCWKPKPIKTADTTMTPEIPRNEYTYTIKP